MEIKMCVTFYFNNYKGEKDKCTQVLQMNTETYNSMTSKDAPEWSSKSAWGKLTKNQRLIEHFNRIKDYFQANRFTFEVFAD